MPDEVERPARATDPGAPQRAADVADALYEFQHAYHRKPESWRDYVLGMGHLARHSARDSLRLAGATTIGSCADAKAAREWYRDMEQAAGW